MIGVLDSCAWRISAYVSVHAVASVEVLADVSANVVLNQELSTRVL